MFLAVDFAAKMSAACLMDLNGRILDEFDSWRVSEDDFLERLCFPWRMSYGHRKHLYGTVEAPIAMVVEDLPHKLPFMTLVKKVCRMQGRLVEKMNSLGHRSDVLFIPPATWLRSYEIKTSKDAAKLVQPKAETFGYRPPLDVTHFKGKERQEAKKVNTDYCAAYLIAKWTVKTYNENNTLDVSTTSRYE